jgi:DNA modification methylase
MDLSTWSKMRLKYKFNDSASFQKNADGTRKPGRKKAGDPDHQRLRGNVWYYKIGINAEMSTDNFSHLHPAPFPEALARDHILSWSNPGDVVLDCFCGSGTTPKMAKILGREYIGIEVSAEYIHLAERRVLATNPPLFAGAGYNTASTPTGGSDTVTALLSQPENIPSNQPVSVPPTSG